MLTVLFSWVIIAGAALLFGKAVTDGIYRSRLKDMGRPDPTLFPYTTLFRSLYYDRSDCSEYVCPAFQSFL